MVGRLSRRTLLRGAAGAAVGLPLLEAMGAEGADAFPRRLVVFFTNNGTVKSEWEPRGTEHDFTLGPILAPLEPFRSDIVVLSGLDVESSYHGPGSGDPHMPGMAHMLTGTEMVTTGAGPYDMIGGGISVDQHIARSIAAPTPFEWLGFGVQAREFRSSPWNAMSYTGPNQPVDPEDDPSVMFDRLFRDVADGTRQADELRALRRSVLDYVRDDVTSLRSKLGGADRMRLDQHLESLRSVERTIEMTTAACSVPTDPGTLAGSLYAHDRAPELYRLQTDLLVHALACDLTRVTNLQWREALGGDSTFTFLGQTETHHDISHRTDAASVAQLVDINTWFAQRFADLLAAMRAVPEGDGTLLDSSVVLWCNELSDGAAHSRRDISWILAGGACGDLRTGRYLRYAGEPHNDLLVSICRLMGVPADTFGNPAYCSGPLAR
jgi:hypothetical protein